LFPPGEARPAFDLPAKIARGSIAPNAIGVKQTAYPPANAPDALKTRSGSHAAWYRNATLLRDRLAVIDMVRPE
jgi:hypothetical protein